MKEGTIRYFTKLLLIEFNNAAIREKRNRQLEPKLLKNLPDDILIPIINVYYHTKDEIRVMLALNAESDIAFLDMSYERFQLIPIAKEKKDDSYELVEETKLKEKFPYGNREWTQTIVKKPYRQQRNFRKKVLEAYNFQCAICNEKEPRILRAAHIVPVIYGENDTVNNGICLCANHEIAFDRGIIKISCEGDIVVTNDIVHIERKKIRYPDHECDYPSKEFLQIKFDMQ